MARRYIKIRFRLGELRRGLIVFGVKDPVSTEPLTLDGGVPENVRPKLGDWLDQVVPRLVEPPLTRLTKKLIHPKPAESKIKPGNVIVAIHIPESENAPIKRAITNTTNEWDVSWSH